jgi:hypothetical protein
MIIYTARGEEILIDEDDYPILGRYRWVAVPVKNGRFYAWARTGGGERESMHRFLMKPPEGMVAHHKNNNGLDNRRSNLEVTTQSHNCRAVHYDRTVGVHEHKQTGRWRAQLRIDGHRVSFGLHDTREEAEAAINEIRRLRDGLS